MSTHSDDRIVNMRLNNSQFESNAKQTLGTLDKLKSSMSFSDTSKETQKSAGYIKEALNSAIDSVNNRFSMMQVAAVTAIQNITNSAVNMAKNLAYSLTIQPITTGLQEYETQINATQTILANTKKEGATISDVNAALDELNTYADKTIYNFTEMTKNIGTFTAAGVDLKTSTEAIQGIANLAAVSGSTSQQASNAMYQLSQALATGTVRLMDWNSVVNAGMGGQVFQDALVSTAKEYGVAVDDIIAKQGSFRESLSEGWLTADIMTETLKKFTTTGVNEYLEKHSSLAVDDIAKMREEARSATDQTAAFKEMAKTIAQSSDMTEDQIYEMIELSETAEDAATKVKTFTQLIDVLKEAAQSGWSQSWRIIIGDFEEAKELWTTISDVLTGVINESANARNNTLKTWKDLGGRTELIEALTSGFKALSSVLGAVKKAADEALPKITGEGLKTAVDYIKQLFDKFAVSEETLNNITRIFKGLFSIIDSIVKIAAPAFSLIFPLLDVLKNLASPIIAALASVGDVFVKINAGLTEGINKIREAAKASGSFTNAVQECINKLDILANLKTLIDDLKNSFGDLVTGMTQWLKDLISGLFNFDISNLINVASVATTVGLAFFFKKVIRHIIGWVDKISEAASSITAIIKGKGLRAILSSPLQNFIDSVDDMLDGLIDTLKKFITSIKTSFDIKSLKTIAEAILMLAGALYILATIDPERLNRALVAMGLGMAEMYIFLKKFEAMHFTGAKGIASLISLAGSVMILAVALKVLSSIGDGLINGLVGLAAIFTALYFFTEGLNKIATEPNFFGTRKLVKKGTGTLYTIALSITILAGVFKLLSTINIGSALVALLGLVSITGALYLFEKGLNKICTTETFFKDRALVKKGTGALAVIAFAISEMAVIFKLLSTISIGQAGVAILGLVAIMGSLLLFEAALMQLNKNAYLIVPKAMWSFVILASAISIMAAAFKKLSTINIESTITAIIGISAIVSALYLLYKGLDKLSTKNFFGNKQLVTGGIGSLNLLASAILILSASVKLLSTMNLEGALIGVVALASIMELLVQFTYALKKLPKWHTLLAYMASLTILTSCVTILAGIVKLLSTLNLQQAVTGIGLFSIILFELIFVLGNLENIEGFFKFQKGRNVIETLKNGLQIMAIAAMFGTMAWALKSLEGISWDAIVKSLVGITAMIGELVLLNFVLSKTKTLNENAWNIGNLAGAIAAMAAAAKVLGEMNVPALLIGVSAMLAVIGMLILATKYADTIAINIRKFAISLAIFGASMLAFGLGSLAFGLALTSIATGMAAIAGSGPTFIAAIQTLCDVILATAPLIVQVAISLIHEFIKGLIDEVPFIVESTLDMLVLVFETLNTKLDEVVDLAVEFLNQVFEAIHRVVQKLDWDKLGETLLVTIGTIGSVIGLMKLAALMKASAKDALIGIAKAALVLAEISLIIAAFGALYKIPHFKEFIDNGGVILESIGAAIGKLIGGLVGGIAAGFSETLSASLPQIGNDLSRFAENITPFLTIMGGVNSDTIDKIGIFAGAMANITAAEFLSSVNELIEVFTGINGFETLKNNLGSLADCVIVFSDRFNEHPIDVSTAQSISYLSSGIKDLSQVVSDNIIEISKFGTLGEELKKFAESLPAFNTNLMNAGITPDTISYISDLAGALKALVEAAPSQGGLGDLLTGQVSLAWFGSQLSLFAKNLGTFGHDMATTGVTSETAAILRDFSEAATILSDNAPKYAGIMQFINGVTDLSSFGTDLGQFAANLGTFGYDMANTGITSETCQILRDFSEAAKILMDAIPTVTVFSILQWKDVGGYASSLCTFATNLEGFGTKMAATGITAETTEIFRNFAEAVKILSEANDTDISKLTESLGKLGEVSLQAVVDSFANALGPAIESIRGSISELINSISEGYSEYVANSAESLNHSGEDIINHFNWGMEQRESLLTNTANNILNSLASIFRDSHYSDFHNAGYWIIQGLSNGMSDNSWIAEQAARSVASAALAAAKEAAGISSPSKKAMVLGRFFTEGFAIGIEELSDKVRSSAENVAHVATSGINSAIARISSLVTDEIDTNPVIRPVMDLSDVESKAGRLTALTSRNGALRISSSMNSGSEIQNGSVSLGSTYSFVQNNYSPKSLSRIDIYRQTKNQLSMLKGLA